MQKNSPKPKNVHWIPPPGRTGKDRTSAKKDLHSKGKASNLKTLVDNRIQTMEFSQLNVTYDLEKSRDNSAASLKLLCSEDDNSGIASVSSYLPFDEKKDDSCIYLKDIKQELKFLNLYYMSLRPVTQKLNRLIGNINIQDDSIQELLSKVEAELNSLFGSLEDLEFSISLFENALSKSSHSESLIKVIEKKEVLLKKLFNCYQDILAIFLMVLEELSSCDKKELDKEREAFTKRCQTVEKKYLTQAAIVKDLERQLSILQGRYKAVDGYNTTLEETKTEFQKMIHDKDLQIRSLTSELTKCSMKQDDEKWINLMEEIKINAQTEKKALKKALKLQKLYIRDKKQELKELEEEKENKVKMLVDLATERDKLRVQMTVTNNELVQARYHIEEIKSQKLKLQNELSESEINLKNQLQEKSEVFKKQLHEKEENESKLKSTIKHLEEELSATIRESDVLKSRHDSIKASLLQAQNEHSVDKVFDEVKSLTSLLQDTKEHFQNFRTPDATCGNSLNRKNSEIESVVTLMQDIKRELLEMKRHESPGNQHDKSNESDLLFQLEELKQKYQATSEENAALKRQLKEFPPTFSEYADENYSANNSESNVHMRDFRLQLALKNEEIWKYKQRKKKLDYQLDEIKDKLQKKEMENVRLFSLEESLRKTEEELKSKRQELLHLEQSKKEESERFLKRIKDLEEKLNNSELKNENLSRYIEMLKVSHFNVFGDS